jgi:hypothetical protein
MSELFLTFVLGLMLVMSIVLTTSPNSAAHLSDYKDHYIHRAGDTSR